MKARRSINPSIRRRFITRNRTDLTFNQQSSSSALNEAPETRARLWTGERRAAAGMRSQWAGSRYVEAEFPDSITARRNVLTALWAGKLMGLADDKLAAYASDPRFVTQIDGKIVRMIKEDFRRREISLSFEEIQRALIRFHRIALHQSCSTD